MKILDEHPHDACGIVGIFGAEDAAIQLWLGLHALQHRGQESVGITTLDKGEFRCRKGMGLVSHVFPGGEVSGLSGRTGIGHVRYSTAGSSILTNAQPILGAFNGQNMALAHNGNIAASEELRARLSEKGALFQTTTDSELILHLLAQNQVKTDEDLAGMLASLGPAFCLVMLFNGKLIAARDPMGYRPLVLGNRDGSFVVASETCAFDQMGVNFIREIEPGEMVIISEQGCRSMMFTKHKALQARCLLELVYFARPDSVVFGRSPHVFRYQSGEVLAKEKPADVDIVVAVPDSGLSAAMGYAAKLGRPLDRGLIRNHYVGRSFIAPSQEARKAAVHMKHNVVKEVVQGKRVALVDDSLIRGTTAVALCKALKNGGAKEVHMRIACPPTRHPCMYGVDFPERSKLIAHNNTEQEVCAILGLDSLSYLPLDKMLCLLTPEENAYCTACW